MARTRARRAHLETTREAGLPRISPISVLAGLVTAYGAFALLASIAGAIANAVDADTEFRTNDWTGSGMVAAAITAVVLFVAYVFGGYVAGRMARRSGMLHGLLVAIASLVVGAIAGGAVRLLSDSADIERNLRSIGVPTDTDQVTSVAVAALVASLVAMLAGGALGGVLGERWHTKLALRAADDNYGPAAEARARAEREDQERQRRLEADPTVNRDVTAGQHRGDEKIDLRSPDQGAVPVSHRQGDEPRYTVDEWRRMEAQQDSRNR